MTDVIVVGGGPAGSTTAGLLADMGFEVVLVDRARFPRAKPCGEFINPGAVRALERLGLAGRIRALGPATVSGWQLTDDLGSTTHGDLGVGVSGWGVDRIRFDQALLSAAADRGAQVLHRIRIDDVDTQSEWVTVTGRHAGKGWQHSARFLVGADGLRSVVARRVGAIRRDPRLRKFSVTCHVNVERLPSGLPDSGGALWIGDRTTVGAAPIRADRSLWNVTVVGDPDRDAPAVSKDVMSFFRDLVQRAGLFDRPLDIADGPWTSGPFDWPVARPTGRGYLLVGDASGYYDPLTGQGIHRALRTAELGAAGVARWLGGERSRAGGVRGYASAIARAFRPGRGVQRVVEEALRRPSVRHRMFERLSEHEGCAGTLVRVTGDVMPARTLLAPAAWAPLLFGSRAVNEGKRDRNGKVKILEDECAP